jgi:nuclear pore complex protein Nup93
VLELLNRQLSQVVSIPGGQQSDRERLQSLAVGVADRYKAQGHTASRQLSQTFYLLLDIMQFFDHYHAKRIDVALDVSTTPPLLC